MIGNRQDRSEKWLSFIVQCAEFFDGARIHFFIAHAPGRGERRLGKIIVERWIMFEEPIPAILDGVRTHAVEKPAAAVQKYRFITIALQYAGDGLDIFRAIAF